MFAALKRMFVDPKQELVKVLGNQDLPTFPAVHVRVLKMLRDPDTDMKLIAAQVAADPGLSVKVLRMVNSAAFGLRRPAQDVRHALTLMGRSPTEGLVLGLAVRSTSPKAAVAGYEPSRFWRAAARRAATAKAIADALDPRVGMVSFTAGMLQDMALPLLAERKQDYGGLLQAWHGGEGELEAMEQDRFGWTHAEVAHWLAADWDFPELLGAAIGGHHEEAAPGPVHLVSLLSEQGAGRDALIEAACSRYGQTAADRVVVALDRGTEDGDALAALMR